MPIIDPDDDARCGDGAHHICECLQERLTRAEMSVAQMTTERTAHRTLAAECYQIIGTLGGLAPETVPVLDHLSAIAQGEAPPEAPLLPFVLLDGAGLATLRDQIAQLTTERDALRQRAERAEAACAVLQDIYDAVKQHQIKALEGEKRWQERGNAEMREKWLIRFAYLTQALASAPIPSMDNPGADLLAVVEAARKHIEDERRKAAPAFREASWNDLCDAVDVLNAKGASDAN